VLSWASRIVDRRREVLYTTSPSGSLTVAWNGELGGGVLPDFYDLWDSECSGGYFWHEGVEVASVNVSTDDYQTDACCLLSNRPPEAADDVCRPRV